MYKKKGSKLLTMYTVQEKDLHCLLCTGKGSKLLTMYTVEEKDLNCLLCTG